MPRGNKNDRRCYTCQYWTGSRKVVSPQFIDYSSGSATCNKTGQNKPAWTSCPEHRKSYDF